MWEKKEGNWKLISDRWMLFMIIFEFSENPLLFVNKKYE